MTIHLATERALVHFLSSVNAVVSCKMSLLGEPLIADRAGVRSLARMSSAVDPQQTLVLEALSTLRARVFRPASISK